MIGLTVESRVNFWTNEYYLETIEATKLFLTIEQKIRKKLVETTIVLCLTRCFEKKSPIKGHDKRVEKISLGRNIEILNKMLEGMFAWVMNLYC